MHPIKVALMVFVWTFIMGGGLHAETDYEAIIDADIKNPWGRGYPAMPTPWESLHDEAIHEMAADPEIAKAMISLNPQKSNVEWFTGIETLQTKKALASLQIALCHPHDDVQVKALRALRVVGNNNAVPFLLIYAQYMDEYVAGSENATLHGIIQEEIANTLSALTGVEIKIKGQDPKGLKIAIARWTRWLDKSSP